MIKATVTGYAGDRLVASVQSRPACARCLDGHGCGMGLLGRQTARPATLTLNAPRPRPAVGSTVGIAARPGVLAAALVGYGLPLAGVLTGAVSGPLAAIGGLAAGVLVARVLVRGRVRWHVVDHGGLRCPS